MSELYKTYVYFSRRTNFDDMEISLEIERDRLKNMEEQLLSLTERIEAQKERVKKCGEVYDSF